MTDTARLADDADHQRHRALTAVILVGCGVSLVTSSSLSGEATSVATYGLAASPFLIALAGLGAAAAVRVRRLHLVDVAVAGSLLAGGIGGLEGQEPVTSLRYLVGSVAMWIVLRTVFDTLMRTTGAVDVVAHGLAWSACALALFSILRQAQAGLSDQGLFTEKMLFAGIGTNYVGSFIVTGGLSSVYLYLRRQDRLMGVLSIVALVALTLGLSRGAFVGYGVAAAMLLALERRVPGGGRFPVTRLVRLVGGVTVAALVLTYLVTRWSGVDLAVLAQYAGRGMSGRDIIWEAALGQGLERPLFGHGLGTAPSVIAHDVPGFFVGASTHSSWLRMLVETGFAGLSLYLLAVLVLIAAVWRARVGVEDDARRRNLVFAWLVGFLIMQTFDTYYLFGLGLRNLVYTVVFLLAGEFVYFQRMSSGISSSSATRTLASRVRLSSRGASSRPPGDR